MNEIIPANFDHSHHDRGGVVETAERGAGLPERLLGALLRVDVSCRTEYSNRAARSVPGEHATGLEPAVHAVMPAEAVINVIGGGVGDERTPGSAGAVSVIRVYGVEPTAAMVVGLRR